MNWMSTEFWSQGWWQGFGGAVALISLLTAFMAIYISMQHNKAKKLSYEVIYAAPLLNIDNKVKGDLQITYKGHGVKQLNILKIKVINNGSLPIKSDDFEGLLEVQIENAETLIDFHFSDAKPHNLPVIGDKNGNAILIQPLLLNVGEYFTIQTIFDGPDDTFSVFARIIGVSEIKPVTERPVSMTLGILMAISLSATFAYIFFIEGTRFALYVGYSLSILLPLVSVYFFAKMYHLRVKNGR
ncbi:hypothetical protein GCM10007423_49370 [Dyadobacter endophyticus]|uniref:Uncharacterized protein n=1 Tax=Dyadobacter endophyticus TaxID=1749036 RepID=A0ABQ1Z561_9BACT|nr:hypothetical protein [Dyadobacter endophyticus]GGH48289.1 hypothetical protein GCM10007423_49370 [Dyadobacter endophyticus]